MTPEQMQARIDDLEAKVDLLTKARIAERPRFYDPQHAEHKAYFLSQQLASIIENMSWLDELMYGWKNREEITKFVDRHRTPDWD
jgi:hypothetical protein